MANRIKEYGWGTLIAVIGSASAIYYTCESCRTDWQRYLWNVLFSIVAWMVLWIINSELNEFLTNRISWIKSPFKRLAYGLAGTIIFTVLAVILLIEGWQLIGDFDFGNYLPIVINALQITFFISLFFHGRSFLFQWKKSAIEAERYQKESIKATYDSLKNQVNPHFLFNSLNALTNLVYQDQDQAAKFIKQLSEVYRYVLDTRDKEVVPIVDELNFLNSYLFLQQIRFGNKLKIEINLEGLKGNLPPLAIQMLMENAIKHNIISDEQPLIIHLYKENDMIVVKNSLQQKKVLSDNSPGVGLENIRKRYAFLSNKPMEVIKDEHSFQVKLPILTED